MRKETEKLEIFLENLPKRKLSIKTDLKLRYGIYLLILNKKISALNINQGLFFKNGILIGSFLLIFFSSASVYIYADNKITQASILYPLKRNIEKIESFLPIEANKKIQLHSRFATRRLAEAEELLKNKSNIEVNSEDKDILKMTLTNAMNELNQAENSLALVDQKASNKEKIQVIRESLQEKLNYLDNLSSQKEKEYAQNKNESGINLEENSNTTDNIQKYQSEVPRQKDEKESYVDSGLNREEKIQESENINQDNVKIVFEEKAKELQQSVSFQKNSVVQKIAPVSFPTAYYTKQIREKIKIFRENKENLKNADNLKRIKSVESRLIKAETYLKNGNKDAAEKLVRDIIVSIQSQGNFLKIKLPKVKYNSENER